MAAINVTCLARYNATREPNKNEHEWAAIHIKKVIKGEELKGKFQFVIKGTQVWVNAQNVALFRGELCRMFARKICADQPLGVTIVPVPNADGVVGSQNAFRTLQITNTIAAACGANYFSRGHLRWKATSGQAHKNERGRDLYTHRGNLQCSATGNGQRVVLFDDVVTTGSQMEASRQILTQAGFHVVGAYAVLDVLDKDARGGPYGWQVTTRDPQDLADMFEQFG
jgi:hypothetical protein